MMPAIAVFAFLARCASADTEVLTEATFDHLTSNGVWFIKFYAPWCGHCQKLAPVIEDLSESSKDVNVAKVDCTKERSICERFSVGSYPTLKVVADGKSYDYNGRRDVASMLAFSTKGYKKDFGERVLSYAEHVDQRKSAAAEHEENERKSAVVQLSTSSFEEQVLPGKGPWLIKFYAPWCGHCKRLAPTWTKLSRTLKETGSNVRVAKVDCTVHRRVCSRFGVNGYPSLFYLNDGQVYRYKGGRTLPAFLDFVESGWKTAESTGPIPEEGFFSKLVDMTIEWAMEHTVLAVLASILVIAIVVAVLVAVLDYWLGADDVAQYKRDLNEKEAVLKEGEVLPPKVASAALAKKTGQKPKDE
ncbi:protein disulfide-isomerase domain [Plasmopara halstedii]|uniref:Protein disulfide-isomerase domain n=1 Tax=Plasmopara halstedii TaxID=4781 RepID=A0A0P1AB10_PLAHL|nr:protein disulfide-isomerase domain [Plasmopara halstedii]CEG37496.1 protein disulfide-isomerase domain [Plasmopara halstedii]|eukprot:XP_024573865.1 protein disulfide-isomerase domain [Plasmopara halstedii]